MTAKDKDERGQRQATTPSWKRGLTQDMVDRIRRFAEARVMHRAIETLLEDLMPLLMPHTETGIVVITGATGAGKSTLARVLLKSLVEEFESLMDREPGTIPFFAVEAYKDGDSRKSFRQLYLSILRELKEPALQKKSLVEIENGILKLNPQGRNSVPALRTFVDSAIVYRHTRVGVIDEAAHLLRLANELSVMDTLKSLANTSKIKWVLVGSFDLFDLVCENGQVARRTAVLNFERYDIKKAADRNEFRRVLKVLQGQWPCESAPNFAAISDEIMEWVFGCIGLMKSFLLEAAAMQMRNDDVWKPEFLQRAVKALAMRSKIEREILEGEERVRTVLSGSSGIDPDKLRDLAQRMESASA